MTCRATRNPKKQDAISKEQILAAIAELPVNATIEDAMECLYNLYKIEHGIAPIGAGPTIAQDKTHK